MSRPVTRSMTRARLSEANEKSEFILKVRNLAEATVTGDDFDKNIRGLLSGELGTKTTCSVYRFVNLTIERIVQSDMTMTIKRSRTSFMKPLETLYYRGYEALDEIENLLNDKKRERPVWILKMAKNEILNYITLFNSLLARSGSTEPIIVQHRKRIMDEKVTSFIKSPYFLELGARLLHPDRLGNGWFEEHGMIDEDGTLE